MWDTHVIGLAVIFILNFTQGSTRFRSLPCPNVCTKEGEPVCANDGMIYKSDCHMRKATCGDSVDVVDWSVCRDTYTCQHECDQEIDLVCGTDGRTYINICLLRVEECLRGVELAHYGPCANQTQACPSNCNGAERDGPVCGSDGNVYKNTCIMRQQTCGQGVVQADSRHCKTTKHCTDRCFKISKITCGSDGKLYNNGCQLKRKNCGKHVYEVPSSFCLNKLYRTKCPIDCSEKSKPVCGSDGQLYSNTCELDKANCGFPLTTFKKITKVPLKNCVSKIETCKRMSCHDTEKLVCGNDGQTYRNVCELQEATCRAGVQIAHYGACQDLTKPARECPIECPDTQNDTLQVVCGSNGNVYPSLCAMHRDTCGERVAATTLDMCQTTRYCNVNCDDEASKYVCGSDGNLYRNTCEMMKQNCAKHVYRVPVSKCLSLFQWTGCGRVCPATLDPVCGSDGKTYLNSCFMQQESCRARSFGTAVERAYYGRCGDPHPQPKYLY